MLNRNSFFNQSRQMHNKNLVENRFYFDLAALCQQVYKGTDCPPLPDNWELFSEYVPDPYEDNGYYGACYIRKSWDISDYYLVVFAHRGTIISFDDIGTSFDNLIGDINIALGKIPAQYYNAKQFVIKTLDRIKFNYQCFQTGHSLGAIIADLLSVLKRPAPFNSYSCTFDNPGSKPIILEMIKNGEADPDAIDQAKICNNTLQSNPNVINTCNEQASTTFIIKFKKWNYDVFNRPMIPIPSNYILNLYYIFGYTPERHAIKTIYEALNENCKIRFITHWSYGLKEGYKQYLSDSSYEGQDDYWSGYAKEIWKKHPDIQEEYHWYYRHFYLDFLDFLRQTRNDITNVSSSKSILFPQDKTSEDIDAIIKEFSIIERNDAEGEHKRCTIS